MRCKLEGNRYQGIFSGSKASKQIIKQALVAGYIESAYSWYEGTGAITDKKEDKKYMFHFTTNGTSYTLPSTLEETLLNISKNCEKEIRKEDRVKFIDYILKSLIDQSQNSPFNSALNTVVLMPLPEENLIEAGLISDKSGQLHLNFIK